MPLIEDIFNSPFLNCVQAKKSERRIEAYREKQ